MSKVQKEKMAPAVVMEIVLFAGLLLTLVGMVVGFYFSYTFLASTASDVAKVQSEARSVDAKVGNLASLETQLKQYQDSMKRAAQIAAESKSYTYQNQAIEDLIYYANRTGVGIVGFNFSQSGASGSSTSTNSSGGTATGGTTSGGSGTSGEAGTSTPAALKSVRVSVQLDEKVEYTNFLRFIYLIEQNLTRMQIANVNMTKSENGHQVTAQALDVEVYIQ